MIKHIVEYLKYLWMIVSAILLICLFFGSAFAPLALTLAYQSPSFLLLYILTIPILIVMLNNLKT
jgi:hypothetical protein